MRVARLWMDWCLMREMRCTYLELLAQPAEELEGFRAFIAGERQAREAAEAARVITG